MGILVLVLLLMALVQATCEVSVHHGEELIRWLRGKDGGFFHPHLTIKQTHDTLPYYGMFATRDIPKDEILLSIPRQAMLLPGKPRVGDRVIRRGEHFQDFDGIAVDDIFAGRIIAISQQGSQEVYSIEHDSGFLEEGIESTDFEHENYPSSCNLVKRLVDEMALGDNSTFSAYVNYLKVQPTGQLPMAWSQEGKDLLMEVLGYRFRGKYQEYEQDLPPYGTEDRIQTDWHERCLGGHNSLEENAYAMVIQRGWDIVLIPVFDMMSHRNGRFLNTESDSITKLLHRQDDSEALNVWASRDIAEGEELYTSYNFCRDCVARALEYGTPDIFWDYGFVEQFPQRWIFANQGVAFDVEEITLDDGSTILRISWVDGVHDKDNADFGFLRMQLERLLFLQQSNLEEADPSIPVKEWESIVHFHEALVLALTEAIATEDTAGVQDRLSIDSQGRSCDADETCAVNLLNARYNLLDVEAEGWADEMPLTCDAYGLFGFSEWETLEQDESLHHDIMYSYNAALDDTCYDLDLKVQKCTSYRPQYHESTIHYPAKFIENVKRVFLIGGGDSMLLHEVLKYPTLELVVVLDLDQRVTRGAFKYFGAQPHWDNTKVQWWYGNITKTLQMLPDDFYDSFDLVVVDLPQSEIRSNDVDVLGTLSLLLKAKGVLVSDYPLFPDHCRLFTYTMNVHFYNVPVTCSRSFVMSSNEVDFLRSDAEIHNIDRFVDDLQLTAVHDFQTRDGHFKGCVNTTGHVTRPPRKERAGSGVLMVVDVQVERLLLSEASFSDVRRLILEAVAGEGLSVLKSFFSSSGDSPPFTATVTVILEEGYILSRFLLNHVAFDIFLWNKIDQQDSIRDALVAGVGAKQKDSTVSSYRIASGGAFIAKTRAISKKHGANLATCSPPPTNETVGSYKRSIPGEPSGLSEALAELLAVQQETEARVIVLCGSDSEPCESVHVLSSKLAMAKQDMLVLHSCDNPDRSSVSPKHMMACELDYLGKIKSFDGISVAKPSVLIVDHSARASLLQVILTIFSSRLHRKRYLSDNFIILAPAYSDDETKGYRETFIEKFHTTITVDDPSFRAEVCFEGPDSGFSVFMMSTGDGKFVEGLVNVIQRTERNLGGVLSICSLRGGEFGYDADMTPSQVYSHSDYNMTSALSQWRSQRPLAHQSILEFESIGDTIPSLSCNRIAQVLDPIFSSLTSHSKSDAIDLEVGDGCIITRSTSRLHVVTAWDGKTHVIVNIYDFDVDESLSHEFQEQFQIEVPGLECTNRNDQPRGIGKVVNFRQDIEEYGDYPYWFPAS